MSDSESLGSNIDPTSDEYALLTSSANDGYNVLLDCSMAAFVERKVVKSLKVLVDSMTECHSLHGQEHCNIPLESHKCGLTIIVEYV